MYALPAQTPYFPPQAEGPEVIELRRNDRTESANVRLETSAAHPAPTHEVKRGPKPQVAPKPKVLFGPALQPKAGAKRMIYIEVEEHGDPNKVSTPARQIAASEKVVYTTIDPKKTAAREKENRPSSPPPPPPAAHKPQAAHGLMAPTVPDGVRLATARSALSASIQGMVQEFAFSRQGGCFKMFKPHGRYGRGTAVKELLEAMFHPSVTDTSRQLVVAHGSMTPQARDEQLFNEGYTLTNAAIRELSPHAREVVKRHLGDPASLQASIRDMEQREASDCGKAVREGIVGALMMNHPPTT